MVQSTLDILISFLIQLRCHGSSLSSSPFSCKHLHSHPFCLLLCLSGKVLNTTLIQCSAYSVPKSEDLNMPRKKSHIMLRGITLNWWSQASRGPPAHLENQISFPLSIYSPGFLHNCFTLSSLFLNFSPSDLSHSHWWTCFLLHWENSCNQKITFSRSFQQIYQLTFT